MTGKRPANSRARRQSAFKKGIWSEWLAATALRFKGYKILARRFKCKSGEIDIVATKGDVIAFVEVKARADLSAAVDAVGYESKRRISNAADYWVSLQKNTAVFSLRFDVIAVLPGKWPVHLEDAF